VQARLVPRDLTLDVGASGPADPGQHSQASRYTPADQMDGGHDHASGGWEQAASETEVRVPPLGVCSSGPSQRVALSLWPSAQVLPPTLQAELERLVEARLPDPSSLGPANQVGLLSGTQHRDAAAAAARPMPASHSQC
jgi:hypothetical protein